MSFQTEMLFLCKCGQPIKTEALTFVVYWCLNCGVAYDMTQPPKGAGTEEDL